MKMSDIIKGHEVTAFVSAAIVFLDALWMDDLFADDKHVLRVNTFICYWTIPIIHASETVLSHSDCRSTCGSTGESRQKCLGSGRMHQTGHHDSSFGSQRSQATNLRHTKRTNEWLCVLPRTVCSYCATPPVPSLWSTRLLRRFQCHY